MAGTTKELVRKSVDFFKNISGKSGVYIITSIDFYKKDDNEKMWVKIGLAKDLSNRLNNYLLCWPSGLYVFGIIFTKNEDSAKRTERSIHQYLNIKNRYIVTYQSHDEEWFELSKNEINYLIDLVEYNKDTKFHNLYPNIDMRNKKVFLFNKIDIYDQLIIANEQVGQDRVKPMDIELKNLLEYNFMKYRDTHFIYTGSRPLKPTKKFPNRSSRSIAKKIDFYD